MSARAEELLAALNNDEDLQAKMAAATTDAERTQLAADAGYGDVSANDVQAAANPSGELSEDQLSAASGAGGKIALQWNDCNTTPTPPPGKPPR